MQLEVGGTDVVSWYSGSQTRALAQKGLLRNLTDLWRREGWDESYPKSLRASCSVKVDEVFVFTEFLDMRSRPK